VIAYTIWLVSTKVLDITGNIRSIYRKTDATSMEETVEEEENYGYVVFKRLTTYP
jgi:hypothetical protein